MTPEPKTSPFAPTRWTLILRARGETPEARAALADLCEAYYPAVLNFLRREGRDDDSARDLTHEFFNRVLASAGFDGADPARGRFRSYLLGALKHFLADHRKQQQRLKRGGGAIPESLDSDPLSEHGEPLEIADDSLPNPDLSFDREWALALMARAVATLEREFSGPKAEQFETLKPWLMGTADISQAEAARQLKLSEGAVKVLIHRLRKRFRELVRSEISQTVRDPSHVDGELQHLIASLS